MTLRDVLPAAAVEGLDVGGEADVVGDALPVEREFEVAQRLARDALDVVLLREQHGLRDGDAELRGEREVEELVVGRPPERVVDDDGAFERRALQEGAVEGHLVRDAVDDEVVADARVVAHAAHLDELGDDLAAAALVDALDERDGERPLAADQQSYFFHGSCPFTKKLESGVRSRSQNRELTSFLF